MTQLEARVQAAIASNRVVGDAARIAVSADEIGTVTLRGTLPSHIQSHAAARAARGVPEVLDVINKIEVKALDPPRSADDAPHEGSAAAKPQRDAGLGPEATPKSNDLDDEVQQLLRESQELKQSEERAEASISEEWRKEHWGTEPENPPPWDKPGPPDRSEP
jgi:BON domain